jgi:hypothetical protein
MDPTLTQPAHTELQAFTSQAIDEMSNPAVSRALHHTTSAETLTTAETDALPNELPPAASPGPLVPPPLGFVALAGLHGLQYAAFSAVQPPSV